MFGEKLYAVSCFCSLSNSVFDGGVTAASTLNVSGATVLGSTVFLTTTPASASNPNQTIFWDANSKALVSDTGVTVQYIKNKIPKITGATAGNIVLANTDGTVYDSGVNIDNITGGTGFYYYLENTGSTTNTTPTPINYLSGTSGILQAGTWSVDYTAIGGNNSRAKSIEVGFYIDNVLQGVLQKVETVATDNRVFLGLSRDLILSGGTHTFSIRFSAPNAGTAVIDFGSIRARLVS